MGAFVDKVAGANPHLRLEKLVEPPWIEKFLDLILIDLPGMQAIASEFLGLLAIDTFQEYGGLFNGVFVRMLEIFKDFTIPHLFVCRDDNEKVLAIDKKMTNYLAKPFGEIGRVFVEFGLVEAKHKWPIKGGKFQKIEDTFTTFFITPLIGQINFRKLGRPKTDLPGFLFFERLVFDPIKSSIQQVTC